jgi:phage-related minor tail protein
MSTTDIRYRVSLDPGNVPANARVAADAVARIGQAGQVSAAQTAAAMRSLPAQMTDVVTQLQGGASPLTILLQQGGQIKDQFGGVGPAIGGLTKYLAGLANPAVAVGVGLTAVGTAMVLGRMESEKYRAELIKTGGIAGVTSSQLAEMASGVSKTIGTQGKAAEVLTEMVATGQVAKSVMESGAKGIVSFSKATGQATGELVQEMASLAKGPAEGLVKLNEKYHFLTASTYAHVVALELEGKTTEATRIAQDAYSQMMAERGAALLANLGALERGWNAVKDGAKSAWDAMLGFDREQSIDKQIAQAKAVLASKKGMADHSLFKGVDLYGVDEAQANLQHLREQKLRDDASATTRAARQVFDERVIMGQKYLANIRDQYDAQTKLTRALRDYQQVVDEQAAAGTPISPDQQERDLAQIRRANVDRDAMAREAADVALGLANARSASTLRLSIAQDQERRLEINRAMGLVSVRDYEEARSKIEAKRIGERIAMIDAEISAEKKRTPQDEAGKLTQQARLVDLGGQRASAQADLKGLPLVQRAKEEARALAESQQHAKDWAQSWAQADQFATQLADQTATAMAQQITSPLARAQAEAEVAVVQLERNAARLRTTLVNQIAMMRADGQAGMADQLQAQLDDIEKKLATAKQGVREKAGTSVVDSYLSRDIGTDLSAGFDKASQSLGAFVQGFSKLVDEQEKYNEARKAAGTNSEKLAAVDARWFAQQLNSYAALTGSAKGFFGEHTAGFKLMETAERGFRAFELGAATQAALIKSGLIQAEVGAKVAGDGTKAASESGFTILSLAQSGVRTAASAVEAAVSSMAGLPFPFNLAALAATSAALAGLGVSLFGGGGSGGSFAKTNSGTGTVLGDNGKASESVSKSLESLRQVDTQTARYAAQMALSLTNIEGGIQAMAAGLVQSGALNAATSGINVGFRRNDVGGAVGGVARGVAFGLTAGISELLGLGGAIDSLVGGLFGTKTSVKGQGISADGQSVTSILSKGFDASYYADIEKKKKTLGITTSTSRSTQLTEADASFESQVTKIVGSYADAIKAASGPLGADLRSVSEKVASFVVDIGRIDLQGLTGEQQQERLSAVFSAMGDRLASAALGGLDDFQRVGEGYLQTVVRVSSGTEQAQSALRHLGVTAVELAQLANKQADVGSEQVKESLLVVEKASNGMSQIIQTLSGSASEIAQTYTALTDVRSSLRLLGLSGQAVGFAMLDGAGSLQSLTDGLAAFREGFLTDGEQLRVKSGLMAAEFAKLGLTMPSSAAGFSKLVKGIDTGTEAGQRLLGGVLGLSQGFADLMDSISAATGGIADEIKRIEGLSVTGGSYATIAAQFAISTASARAGDVDSMKLLPSLSQSLLRAAEDSSTSLAGFQAVQANTLSSLKDTLALVGSTGLYAGGSGAKSELAVSADKTTSAVDQLKAQMLTALSAQTNSVNELVSIFKKASDTLESISNPGESINVKVLP